MKDGEEKHPLWFSIVFLMRFEAVSFSACERAENIILVDLAIFFHLVL